MCPKLVSPPCQPVFGQPAPVLMSLPRPVYFRSYPLPDDTGVEQHQHPFAEFLYAREGSMRVEIEGKTGRTCSLRRVDPRRMCRTAFCPVIMCCWKACMWMRTSPQSNTAAAKW